MSLLTYRDSLAGSLEFGSLSSHLYYSILLALDFKGACSGTISATMSNLCGFECNTTSSIVNKGEEHPVLFPCLEAGSIGERRMSKGYAFSSADWEKQEIAPNEVFHRFAAGKCPMDVEQDGLDIEAVRETLSWLEDGFRSRQRTHKYMISGYDLRTYIPSGFLAPLVKNVIGLEDAMGALLEENQTLLRQQVRQNIRPVVDKSPKRGIKQWWN